MQAERRFLGTLAPKVKGNNRQLNTKGSNGKSTNDGLAKSMRNFPTVINLEKFSPIGCKLTKCLLCFEIVSALI